MFDKATRLKLRFETPKGLLSVEDIWDLPLTSTRGANLDDLAVSLHNELTNKKTVSFVEASAPTDLVLQLKFDIVKYIIDVRKAENAEAKEKADKKARKERILAVIERKQNEALEGAPLEDLQKMLAEL